MSILEDEYGDIVRKARVGHGLSPGGLAEDVGLDVRQIEAIESYEWVPERSQSDALAKRLNLNHEALWAIAEERYNPKRMQAPEGVEILSFTFPGMDSKGYAVRSKATGATFFFDPGGNPEEIIDALNAREWAIDAFFVTHGHSDHVAGLDGARRHFAAPVYASAKEWSGEGIVDVDGRDAVEVAGETVRIIHCPGHTAHGVTFVFGPLAIVGDTLFAGSLGGPLDGPVYYDRLLASAEKILSLPDDTLLLPGHGPATTVAQEKRYNPFVAR